MYDLSILIPSRNEMFLAKTIENILENIEGKTEIIVGLDGKWSDPPITDDPRVTLVYYPESVGQRAMTNRLCALSKAKYVMKVDAHCAFDKGFDVKMMNEMNDNWTMVPVMKNLHAFDWVCNKCGDRRYQGPTPTKCNNSNCDNKTEFTRDMKWEGKKSPNSKSYCFDSTPHFQYFGEYEKTAQFKKDLQEKGITESMSLQGSCFMLTREKYWELNICDESFGSWGSQGIEVACKTWLSGGRVVCNHKTWYAHMFRTQGGDFGFPYPLPGSQVQSAKKLAQSLFMNGKWEKQVRPLSWLLQKFWPVPGWENIPIEEKDKTPTKGIIFYTDNQLKLSIAHKVQNQLKKSNLPIVSASLKPMNLGKNVYLPLKRGYLTMFKQILAALEALDTEIVFFCEHDVLYDPSVFEFTPKDRNIWYYNTNVWKLNWETGHAIRTDDCKQVSGICVYRETAVKHYQKRVKILRQKIKELNEEEFNRYIRAMGFEPGTHNRLERIDDNKCESFQSEIPLVDIRHDKNLTSTRWSPDQFVNKKFTEGWIESEIIPGWDKQKILK